jgi:hypothetical protein
MRRPQKESAAIIYRENHEISRGAGVSPAQCYNKNDARMLAAEDWVCVMDHFIRSDRETKECFLESP